MILQHTPSDELGHRGMGTAELLLNASHAEYSIDTTASGFPKLAAEYWDDMEDGERDDSVHDSVPLSVPEAFREPASQLDLDGWESVLHLTGPVVELARAFYRLALDLDPSMDPTNYTPGGDDDTFDYWPSGMRLLHQLATDLDDLTMPQGTHPADWNSTGDRYITRYRQVLAEAVQRNVPEMSGAVPEADDNPAEVTTPLAVLDESVKQVTVLVEHYQRDRPFRAPESVPEHQARLLNQVWSVLKQAQQPA